QAILLVAPASYEERVLALVQGKRHLFDNVVDPDATDDVVGVSRRLAEILAEDLRAPEPGERDEPQVTVPVEAQAASEPTGPEPVAMPAASGAEAQEGPDVEETVRRCITDLQQRFGPRIERILGQRGGGDGGSRASLVLVLDQVDARDDEAIEALAAEIPVALIDQRTLRSLNRLGSASPLAGAESVYATLSTNDDQESESPLARKAVRNLEAARLLLQQSCPAPALDLLLDAMLAAAALLAGRADPPTVQQAGVWLYGEALPTGRISPAHAGLLMQAIALAQAGDTIPADLLHPLLDDAQALIHSATPGSDQGN
ncbi:MAG: helicase, partial [Thioalkalivibrio sp.]